MRKSSSYLWLLLAIPCLLLSKEIQTFYGPLEVTEPVLIELIDSPAMQRLKQVHQYGVGYYTTHPEEFNRYDHSLGVFAVLRKHNRSLEEQIAGLLHDVSHTVFSHVGDWIFDVYNQKSDYQNSIHAEYLVESGLEALLNKHGFEGKNLLPKGEWYPALEQPLPALCADRIDYNIQGAYHYGWITYNEAIQAYESLRYTADGWVSTNPKLMEKIGRYSLKMTKECWGGPVNHLLSTWLAEAIHRAYTLGDLTMHAIHHEIDDTVWEQLLAHEDPMIIDRMDRILHRRHHIRVVTQEEGELWITSKFRGINPLVETDDGVTSLTSWSLDYKNEFEATRAQCERGWHVLFHDKPRAALPLQSSLNRGLVENHRNGPSVRDGY